MTTTYFKDLATATDAADTLDGTEVLPVIQDAATKHIALSELQPDWDASSGVTEILNKPTLGTAAAADTGDFATAAQGALADTAVQPDDLATVATSGDYDDLSNLPNLGTAAAANTGDFATAAQGTLADSAVQPGDLAAVATGGAYADLTNKPSSAIGYVIDGNDAAILAGELKNCLRIPFTCTIDSVSLLADQSGSIVVDIWKDNYTNYPPTNADSICASAKPTLSSQSKSEDTTLTGWTKSIAAGDVLKFNVVSASTVQHVTLTLKVTK